MIISCSVVYCLKLKKVTKNICSVILFGISINNYTSVFAHTKVIYPQRFSDAEIAWRVISWQASVAACQLIPNRPPRKFRVCKRCGYVKRNNPFC